MPLLTVADQVPPAARAGAAAEWAPRRYWSSITPIEQAMAAPLGPPEIAVSVYANHGRWVVECPDCSGAQMASPDDPRFMCTICANVAVEGMWRPVTWPTEAVAIDDVLSARPLLNRNWIPGETLDDLAAEEPAPAPIEEPA